MATAEELLAATGDAGDTIVVDLDSRTLTIPETMTNIGVMSDDDVKWLYFVVPRYYRNVDLSEFDIRINFQNAAGNGDQYPVPPEDIEVDDSTEQIKFSWRIDRTAYEAAGSVTFSMCMVKYDDEGVIVQELNSTTATLKVLAGLETIEAVVENNPSAFDNVLFRLKAVENAMGLGVTGYYNIIDVNIEGDDPVLTIASHDGEIEYTITDGKDGEDGYTPVKGVDYYTEEDKTELETSITTNVTNYVDTWAPVTSTISLLVDNWVDNQQTVDVEGLKADSLIFVGPENSEANYEAYNESGVRCTAQAEGQLTFSCTELPEVDVVASVCIYNANDWPDENPQTMTEYIDEQIASRVLPTSIETTITSESIIMTAPMDDGSTSTHVIALDADGYPSSITIDGVVIPMTWTVETTSESTTE